MFVCCECCVLSGRGLCDELITRPEESYRLWFVVVCDLETSRMWKPWPALGRSATAKKKNYCERYGDAADPLKIKRREAAIWGACASEEISSLCRALYVCADYFGIIKQSEARLCQYVIRDFLHWSDYNWRSPTAHSRYRVLIFHKNLSEFSFFVPSEEK